MAVRKITDKVIIIFNPVSGKGIINVRNQIRKEANNLGWQGKIFSTSLKKGAGKIADIAIKKGVKHIIVCGGDGTVREVLEQTVHKNILVGIIPLGTGNIFAKNLKIPLSIPEAVHTALLGKSKRVDIASANGHYFILIAGMGFDVEAIKDTDYTKKNRWGRLAYLLSGLKNINKKSQRYRLIIDKKSEFIIKAKSVLVANIGKSEGGIKIVPGASPQSADLKIGVIKANSLLSWLDLLVNALHGKIYDSPSYDLYEGHIVDCYPLNGEENYECDGDEFPKTDRLTMQIYPKAIQVLT
jgi:YegS/Rv2252/BmrU family lipid kinase